jgi:hypothetical protein
MTDPLYPASATISPPHTWLIYVSRDTVNGRETLRLDFRRTQRWGEKRPTVTRFKAFDNLPSELLFALAELRAHGDGSSHFVVEEEFHVCNATTLKANPWRAPSVPNVVKLYASTKFFTELMGVSPTENSDALCNYAVDA